MTIASSASAAVGNLIPRSSVQLSMLHARSVGRWDTMQQCVDRNLLVAVAEATETLLAAKVAGKETTTVAMSVVETTRQANVQRDGKAHRTLMQ